MVKYPKKRIEEIFLKIERRKKFFFGGIFLLGLSILGFLSPFEIFIQNPRKTETGIVDLALWSNYKEIIIISSLIFLLGVFFMFIGREK